MQNRYSIPTEFEHTQTQNAHTHTLTDTRADNEFKNSRFDKLIE